MISASKISSQSLIILLLVVISCSPSANTRITGSWMNPSVNENYNKILVAAMTDNTMVKQTVEDAIFRELAKQGVEMTKSISLFPPRFEDEELQKSTILDLVKGSGHDAILTVALLEEETESRYVPGGAAYAPVGRFGYYGNFWGYYSNLYPTMYEPGYYRQDKIYYVETNLYDVETEELIWSAQTETINPNSLERAAKKLAEVTTGEMVKRNLF